jgi:hypothetical protein
VLVQLADRGQGGVLGRVEEGHVALEDQVALVLVRVARPMSASWVSRVWLVVRSMTPQKMALCSAMRKQAKLTPKTMAKYLLRSPINILRAIQVMACPFLPGRAPRTHGPFRQDWMPIPPGLGDRIQILSDVREGPVRIRPFPHGTT